MGNINASLMGQMMFAFILLITLISYFLGKKKTTTPKMTTLIGFLLAFIPPLGLIYIAFLVLKDDVEKE